MEDNQYPVVKKPHNGCLWAIIVAILVMIATAAIVFTFHDSIAKTIMPKGETVCEDTVTVELTDSVLTVQDVLEFREGVREGMRVDSIFLAIPDPVLIEILMTHGTSLSNSDIVYIYESNKEHYDSILKGSTIQRDILTPMDSVKNSNLTLKR